MYKGDAGGLGDSFAEHEMDNTLATQNHEIEYISSQIQQLE